MSYDTVFKVTQLDASCWQIEEEYTRSFLLVGTQRALLIDTGLGTGNLREVVESLTDLPVTLVNTHADHDHMGGNRYFDKAYMHPAEYCMYKKEATRETCPPIPLWEGTRFDLGGRVIEAILTPGHTPGSLAFFDEGNRVLFGGDGVQAGVVYMFGYGRDMESYIASMERLEALIPKVDVIYAPHGPTPLEPGILTKLREGAQAVLRGEVPSEEIRALDTDVLSYDVGVATILGNKYPVLNFFPGPDW